MAEHLHLTPDQFHIIETWQPGAGELLKQWRESRGMSQSTLADKCFCEGSLISYWENDKKQPSGRRKELLLAAIAPAGLVRVSDDGLVTGQDLDLLCRRIEADHETPDEQWYFLLRPNISKILICLIQKSTGNIMPGVDVKAAVVVLDFFKDVRRTVELSQSKSKEVKLSQAAKKWLGGDVYEKANTGKSDTPIGSDDSSLHNTSTETSQNSTATNSDQESNEQQPSSDD